MTTSPTDVAKYRMINTRFWDDSYIAGLNPSEKLLFLYLLTNPLTTIAGVYEIEFRRMAFDTGLGKAEVSAMVAKLEKDGKLIYQAPWLAIVNFVRHQSLNPKVVQGITLALDSAPEGIVGMLNLPPRIRLSLCGRLPLPPRENRDARRGGMRHIGELLSRE